MTDEMPSARRTRGKAVQLLNRVIASGWFDVQRVATELVVSERTVAQYMSGEAEMPLERQRCLAKFLVDNVPPLSRQAHNLLSQVRAAIRFNGTDTMLHQTAPVPNPRSY